MQESNDRELLEKGEEYVFKLNTLNYKKGDYYFEIVLYGGFLLIYEEDLMKLFHKELEIFGVRSRKNEFRNIIKSLYEKKVIKVEKSRYIFMTKGKKRYVYYSLETIFYLLICFSLKETIITDITEFLEWGTNQQKKYLASIYSKMHKQRERHKLFLENQIVEYSLPQEVHIGNTIIHTDPNVIANMNAELREACEEQRKRDVQAEIWAKTHGAG